MSSKVQALNRGAREMFSSGVMRSEKAKEGRERLRLIMKESGVTMSEVAERIGISRQAMYKRMSGNMSLESFCEIADVLGYEVELRKK